MGKLTTPAQLRTVHNLLWNPSLHLWTRGVSFTDAVNNQGGPDCWNLQKESSSTLKYTMSRNDTQLPTVAESGAAPAYSASIECTQGLGSLPAGCKVFFYQGIEGHVAEEMYGAPYAFDFWVRSSKTGALAVSFVNYGKTVSYVTNVTINAANTWEHKYVFVPAPPVASYTFQQHSEVYVYVRIGLAVGSTMETATVDQWQAGNYGRTAASINFNVNNDRIYFALPKLVRGHRIIPFYHTAIPTEYLRCRTRYWKTFREDTTPAQGAERHGAISVFCPTAGDMYYHYFFPSKMRKPPAVTFYNPVSANDKWYNDTDSADSEQATTTGSTVNGDALGVIIKKPAQANDENDQLRIHLTADIEPTL